MLPQLTAKTRASIIESVTRARNYSTGTALASLGIATESGIAWLPTEIFLEFVAAGAICEVIREQLEPTPTAE